jgi:membrane protein YqaA with SNARE-associated domain
LFLVDWLWIDLDPIFQDIVDNVHDTLVFALFTVSELFFGIIPPEVFMIWAIKHEPFILYISLLAVLSYLSGIMAYKMGSYIHSFERVKNYIDVRIQKYVKMLKRWGGVLIIAGAILPIPYASVCMAAGLVQYNFRSYLLYGLVRILRYYVYGYILLYII